MIIDGHFHQLKGGIHFNCTKCFPIVGQMKGISYFIKHRRGCLYKTCATCLCVSINLHLSMFVYRVCVCAHAHLCVVK